MNMPAHSRGITLIGFLIMLCVAGFFAYVAMQLDSGLRRVLRRRQGDGAGQERTRRRAEIGRGDPPRPQRQVRPAVRRRAGHPAAGDPAALALLFAIFRYKPSPFCILDEVDAPLDEVNNERFVRLVRDMSRDTQFIVITHSRRTMEAADVLYGVTMEEAGCSRLVSVQFADLEA